MGGIVSMALQWLTHEKDSPGSSDQTSHHIIESLLAEIRRVEATNAKILEDDRHLKTDAVDELKAVRMAVAEECAVICETADYAVRSYGCAREIRLKYGLPFHK